MAAVIALQARQRGITVALDVASSCFMRLYGAATWPGAPFDAAAWCSADGAIALLREDVGRHSALDKLLGAVYRAGLPASEGFIVVTSRASYEMVQKTASAGVGLLAAVSGVTGLAIDTAQACGLTLLGFARGADLSVYSHPQRISLESTTR